MNRFACTHRRNWTAVLSISFLLLFLRSATAQTVSLPFDTAGDMILVKLKVDNAERVMLFDTGAAHTIVGEFNSKKAKARETSTGIVLEARARAVTIQLGNSPSFRAHVLEANLDDFGKRFGAFGTRVDGILGQDLLQRFHRVSINYKSQTLELVQ